MVQLRSRPRFLHKPGEIACLFLHDLNRDAATEFPIKRFPDDAHAARAQRAEDLVGTQFVPGMQGHGTLYSGSKTRVRASSWANRALGIKIFFPFGKMQIPISPS